MSNALAHRPRRSVATTDPATVPRPLPPSDPRARVWNRMLKLGARKERLEVQYAEIVVELEDLIRQAGAKDTPPERRIVWEDLATLGRWSRAKVHTVLGYMPPNQRLAADEAWVSERLDMTKEAATG